MNFDIEIGKVYTKERLALYEDKLNYMLVELEPSPYANSNIGNFRVKEIVDHANDKLVLNGNIKCGDQNKVIVIERV